MKRRFRLLVYFFSLLMAAGGLALLALFVGIPLFLKQQLPNYIKVETITVQPLLNTIQLHNVRFLTSSQCTMPVLAIINKISLKVVPLEARIKKLEITGFELFPELKDNHLCGIPPYLRGNLSQTKAIQWSGLKVQLVNGSIVSPANTYKVLDLQGSFSLRRIKQQIMLDDLTLQFSDSLQGSHELNGKLQIILPKPNEPISPVIPKGELKLKTKFSNLPKILAPFKLPVIVKRGEAAISGELLLKENHLTTRFYLHFSNLEVSPKASSTFFSNPVLVLPFLQDENGSYSLAFSAAADTSDPNFRSLKWLRASMQQAVRAKIQERIKRNQHALKSLRGLIPLF